MTGGEVQRVWLGGGGWSRRCQGGPSKEEATAWSRVVAQNRSGRKSREPRAAKLFSLRKNKRRGKSAMPSTSFRPPRRCICLRRHRSIASDVRLRRCSSGRPSAGPLAISTCAVAARRPTWRIPRRIPRRNLFAPCVRCALSPLHARPASHRHRPSHLHHQGRHKHQRRHAPDLGQRGAAGDLSGHAPVPTPLHCAARSGGQAAKPPGLKSGASPGSRVGCGRQCGATPVFDPLRVMLWPTIFTLEQMLSFGRDLSPSRVCICMAGRRSGILAVASKGPRPPLLATRAKDRLGFKVHHRTGRAPSTVHYPLSRPSALSIPSRWNLPTAAPRPDQCASQDHCHPPGR